MAIGQVGLVGWFIDNKRNLKLLSIGFSLAGVALILLMLTRDLEYILLIVGVLAFGMAILIPTLATLVSMRSVKEPGAALGLQTAVNSLGQFAGPVAGGILLNISIHLPYLLAGIILIGASILLLMKKSGFY